MTRGTAAGRLLRGWAPGAEPLARRSDRVQAVGRLVVVLSFCLAPPAALATSSAASAHLRSMAADQAAERTLTRAVLVEDAPAPATVGSGAGDGASTTAVPAPVTWSGPDGTSSEGTLLVPPRTEAGTAVDVWIDREGDRTPAPLDPATIPTRAAATAAVPLIGLPLGTWVVYVALGSGLDARRERAWAEEWAAVEPEWRSRLL